MQEKKSLKEEIRLLAENFLKEPKDKEIIILSHFDTDGISSATIFIQALKNLDRKFSLKIVKNLEEELISKLPKDKTIVFLDLASGSLHHLEKYNVSKNCYIIDHHEINQEIPKELRIINPHLNGDEKISSSGLTYLFCKELDKKNKEFAKLAVLGMIGDQLEKEIDKLNEGILNDSEIKRKRGLLIYPSTRPLNRTLEFCSNPYIPGVTGETKGVLELLRETGIKLQNGKYKSLIELDEDEMKKLTTAIILRNPKIKNKELIGDIFLIKMFNKLEDAREISAIINACSRSGNPEIAIQFCMEINSAKKKSEAIYAKYKQNLISSLKFAENMEKINGKNFVIINAREKIQETIIGTIASILSHSRIYKKGTVITAMAYYKDKIKVSVRNVGNCGRNVREILSEIIKITGGEVGGHEHAAGCIIKKEKEKEFIDLLKKNLEIEVIKV